MINKKIKTLIATLAITSLTTNIAFAEIMDLRNPESQEANVSNNDQKIDIVKALKEQANVSIDTFTGEYHQTGRPDNGSKGVTIAAAYLTPTKTFGYMYIDGYKYTGTGRIYIDTQVSTSGSIFAGRTPPQGANPNNLMYNFAKNLFSNKDLNAFKTVFNATETDLKNGKYLIQEANDGRKFIASTFYVRYTYDIASSYTRDDPYQSPNPVLPTSFTGGPYLAMGDFFDETLDVIGNSAWARARILDYPHIYLKPLSEVLGKSIPSGIIGLTVDDVPVNGLTIKNPTSRAVLEKRYEYRRYVKNDVVLVDNPAEYEFVYSVINTSTKNQTVIPDISPEISISSRTEYEDESKGTISKYIFDVNLITKDTDKTYSEDTPPYVVRRVSDRPANEPAEDQMDLWHTDVSAVFDIVDANGESRLLAPISIGDSSTTVYVTPDDIVPNDKGSKSLDNCTAKVNLTFKNNARYMANKEVYSYHYNHNGTNKTYEDVITYIETKPTGLQLKTGIQTYQTNTDPREILTYKTETSAFRTIEASAGIFSIISGDYTDATLSVTVTPPNTLTVLEGADFTVDLDIDTNGVPIGYDGSDTWITDFKIDEVLITALNGDTIHRETNIPVDPETPITVVNKQINGLTAQPSHVGKATVKVTYSYIINKQTYRKEPIANSGRLDADGNMIWDYNTIKDPVQQLPQYGTVENYFNIFSVTGNTVTGDVTN